MSVHSNQVSTSQMLPFTAAQPPGFPGLPLDRPVGVRLSAHDASASGDEEPGLLPGQIAPPEGNNGFAGILRQQLHEAGGHGQFLPLDEHFLPSFPLGTESAVLPVGLQLNFTGDGLMGDGTGMDMDMRLASTDLLTAQSGDGEQQPGYTLPLLDIAPVTGQETLNPGIPGSAVDSGTGKLSVESANSAFVIGSDSTRLMSSVTASPGDLSTGQGVPGSIEVTETDLRHINREALQLLINTRNLSGTGSDNAGAVSNESLNTGAGDAEAELSGIVSASAAQDAAELMTATAQAETRLDNAVLPENRAVLLKQASALLRDSGPAGSMSIALATESANSDLQQQQLLTTTDRKNNAIQDFAAGQNQEALLSRIAARAAEAVMPGSPALAEALQTGADPAMDTPTIQPRSENAPGQPRLQHGTAPVPMNQQMYTGSFATAFGEAAWGEELTRHVSLLVAQRSGSAQIQLDPPDLGSLMVRINITGEQASINFVSPHLQVRDALELNMDRLQSMLGEQGFSQVDVDVSDQRQHDSRQEAGNEQWPARALQSETDEIQGKPALQALGLVDYYA